MLKREAEVDKISPPLRVKKTELFAGVLSVLVPNQSIETRSFRRIFLKDFIKFILNILGGKCSRYLRPLK